MDLSIVTSLYQAADYLEEFYARARAAAEKLTADYEFVLVNDGSTDDTQRRAEALCARDPRVRLLELSRNFGHHKALLAGLARARGRRVFLIDSDLEEEPELLERFAAVFDASGADVVYGVQETRRGGWFERFSGSLFYRVFNALSDQTIPKNAITARLMSRRYVRCLVKHRDRDVFIDGLWAATGFRQVPLRVTKLALSPSSYNLSRKLGLLVSGLTSFSDRPLWLILYLGFLLMVLSGSAGVVLVVRQLLGDATAEVGVLTSIWFLGGLGIFCQGVLAVYLSKVYLEVKRRPRAIVRRFHGNWGPREQHDAVPGNRRAS